MFFLILLFSFICEPNVDANVDMNSMKTKHARTYHYSLILPANKNNSKSTRNNPSTMLLLERDYFA